MLAARLSRDIHAETLLVMKFGRESPDVMITIDSRFTGFVMDIEPRAERTAAELFAFYLAGSVRHDLIHPELRDDRLADVPSGLRAVLRRYHRIRAADPLFRDAFLERVAWYESRGRLEEFVRETAESAKRR